jgi:hypothetical protein
MYREPINIAANSVKKISNTSATSYHAGGIHIHNTTTSVNSSIFNTTKLFLPPSVLRFTTLILLLLAARSSSAQLGNTSSGGLNSMRQQGVNYNKPKEYSLGGITVSGAQYLDQDLLIAVTNLLVGQKVMLPNDEGIAKAIKALWKQELFSNIEITVTKIIDDKVFINDESNTIGKAKLVGRHSFGFVYHKKLWSESSSCKRRKASWRARSSACS